jgi:putative N-acetyltransferase (TIGR04045 family)
MPDTVVETVESGAATARRALCRVADDPWSIDQHHRIRHDVFVEEQRLFHPSDHDEHDDDPATIKVLSLRGAEPVGAVRLYPLDAARGLWQGDRLAVLPSYRRFAAGAPLVRFAVRTAGERGGALMVAHIQLANVPFFERLGWRCDGPVEVYVGVRHQPMAISLHTPSG